MKKMNMNMILQQKGIKVDKVDSMNSDQLKFQLLW